MDMFQRRTHKHSRSIRIPYEYYTDTNTIQNYQRAS